MRNTIIEEFVVWNGLKQHLTKEQIQLIEQEIDNDSHAIYRWNEIMELMQSSHDGFAYAIENCLSKRLLLIDKITKEGNEKNSVLSQKIDIETKIMAIKILLLSLMNDLKIDGVEKIIEILNKK